VNNEPRVVIIAGGFDGLCAARGLAGGSRRYRSDGGVLRSDDSKWITGETLLISGGVR
jgi:hypothetical protein